MIYIILYNKKIKKEIYFDNFFMESWSQNLPMDLKNCKIKSTQRIFWVKKNSFKTKHIILSCVLSRWINLNSYEYQTFLINTISLIISPSILSN